MQERTGITRSVSVVEVLERVRTFGMQEGITVFKSIKEKEGEVFTNCPMHSGGNESHPSFSIGTSEKHFGVGHCFACGFTGDLSQIVSVALGKDDDGQWGEQWLNWNFGGTFVGDVREMTGMKERGVIALPRPYSVIDDTVIDEAEKFPKYLEDRGISHTVMDLFDVRGEESFTFKDGVKRPAVMFPWRDRFGKIRIIFRRSTVDKVFDIPAGVEKPVYGLNELWKKYMVYPETPLYVCESIIDALTLWTWGYPAVALLGTGNKRQIDTLLKLRNRIIILCLDGDTAGTEGAKKLKEQLETKTVFTMQLPEGKDINDLTREEFVSLSMFM